MHVAILDCSTILPGLEGHDTVGEHVSNWLSPAMPDVRLEDLKIGYGAPVPKAGDYDAYIVSGSEKGVYDPAPWMQPVRNLLLDIREADTPVFGICFGHQLMADTFGGRAKKADTGWAAGVRRFTVEGQTFDAHVLHQDQVVEVPPGAEVIGQADYCPNAVLRYDFKALSTQFHPEYPALFVNDIIDLIEDDILGSETAERARQSMRGAAVSASLYGRQASDLLCQ